MAQQTESENLIGYQEKLRLLDSRMGVTAKRQTAYPDSSMRAAVDTIGVTRVLFLTPRSIFLMVLPTSKLHSN